ncbi:MAG TPA: folate-binding protein [Lacunisphaera sp.]|jgi:folate-binding protein YgfZ|nr:folate-binding protein [Lacunisphaera sp.]
MSGNTKIFPNSPGAVLAVAGDDADAFLQGQFTNDLRQAPGAAMYGLFLSQKGKVMADAYALKQRANAWFLVSPNCPAAAIARRLTDYIVADDVSIEDETGATAGLAVFGPGASDSLAPLIGAAPGAGVFGRSGDLLVFRGRRSTGENFEIIGPAAACHALTERLCAAGCVEATPAEVAFERISAQVPSVPQDLGEGDLPNEGSLQDAAISYTKGCYLGQEVMSRLKNLGQVRRRLFVVTGTGDAPPSGTPLFQRRRKVGEIRSAAAAPGKFVAMAMLSLVPLDERGGLAAGPDADEDLTIISRVGT